MPRTARVALNLSCSALSPALRREWACVARTLQSVPNPERRSSFDRFAIHRTQSSSCQHGEEWQWSSARLWLPEASSEIVHKGPVPRGQNWLQWVNEPQTEAEVLALRHSVNRGTPFGSKHWIARTAKALRLESTTRPRGRPKKGSKK